jgi:hypothetical protein
MILDKFDLCSENTNEEVFVGFRLLGLNLIVLFIVLQLLPGEEGYFIIFFGLQLLGYSLWRFQRIHSLSNWYPTNMKVLHTEIITKETHSELGISECFQPIVEYQYEVNGRVYNSNIISLDTKSVTFLHKEDIEKLFSMVQKDCTAYFNPLKAQESVLFNDIPKKRRSHYYALVTIGVILLGIGIWLQTYLLV